MKICFKLFVLFFFSLLYLNSAFCNENTSSEMFVVPRITDVFEKEIESVRVGEEDTINPTYDGKCLEFEQNGYKIIFNDREITLLSVPKSCTIIDLADFIYDQPYKLYLEKKIANCDVITLGDLELFDFCYNTQLEAMKVIVSLGYQAVIFHKNINEKAAAVKMKHVTNRNFTDGTILQDSIVRFYDSQSLFSKNIFGWGKNFSDKDRVDALKYIVAGQKNGAKRQKWSYLNKRFYIYDHMNMYDDIIEVKENEVSTNDRLEYWKSIDRDVSYRMNNLKEIYFYTSEWVLKTPPSTIKRIFEEKTADKQAENRHLVRKAREIFYDLPFVIATMEFRNAIADCRTWLNVRSLNDSDGMRIASSKFVGDSAGDLMLKNIKSGYSYDYYLEVLAYLKDSLPKDELLYESILLKSNFKDLADLETFKSGEGDALWVENAVKTFDAVKTKEHEAKVLANQELEAELARKKAEAEANAEVERLKRQQEIEAAERERKQKLEAEALENERKRESERLKREAEAAERNRLRELEEQEKIRKHEEHMRKRELEAEERRQQKEIEKAAKDAERLRAQKAAEEAKEKRIKAEQEAKSSGIKSEGWFSRTVGAVADLVSSDSDEKDTSTKTEGKDSVDSESKKADNVKGNDNSKNKDDKKPDAKGKSK